MRARIAPLLPLVVLSLIVGGCARFRAQPLTWRLVVQVERSTPDIQNATSLTAAIIERRLDILGVRDAKVNVIDATAGRIQIQLPEVSDRERFKAFLTAGGKLEIVHVISPPSPAPIMLYDKPETAATSAPKESGTSRVLPYLENGATLKKWANVEVPALISNRDVRNADAIPASEGFYSVAFTLRREGAQKLAAWTEENINEYVGVVLNDEIKSVAFIKSQISDSAQITGNFTKASAEDLAQILISGPLSAPIRIVEESKN